MVPRAGRACLSERRLTTYIRSMKRSAASFGLVMLVVVMAIVLLLVARSWQSVAPVAAELPDPSVRPERSSDDDGSDSDDALPGLDEMRAASDEHADRVQEALAATD